MATRKTIVIYSTALLLLVFLVSAISMLIYLLSSELLPLFDENAPFSLISMNADQIRDSFALEITPIDEVWDMLEQVDQGRALSDLRQLTGEEPICLSYGCYTITNRLTGSTGLDWAQDYLYETLVDLGYSVEFDDWSASGYADQNVIARKEGMVKEFEEVYLVAHVDGVKSTQDNYPAADDNASSVVNGLELARIFSNLNFQRTLVLFFSSGEEQGFLGVKSYMDQLPNEAIRAIRYAVNRDMTGYDGDNDGVMGIFHGDHSPSIELAEMMGDIIHAYQLDLDPRVVAGCP